MKPSEYKAIYENLKINTGDGHSTAVSISKYRLGQPKDGGATRKLLTDKIGPKGIEDFELRVGPGDDLKAVDAAFTKTPAFRTILASPFTGKGAPEHCQVVLQLVKHFWPATDLPKYAEDNLGLDCNGFVGNFLWHGWMGHPWTDPRRGDHDTDGPDTRLDGFLDVRRKNRVRKWSDINTNLLYLFIRTTDAGDIIVNSSGNPIGHIVISEIGSAPLAASTPGGRTGVRVVESTGSHIPPGLSENSYTWVAEKNAGTGNAIFKVDRGSDIGGPNKQIWFLVVQVDPAKSP